MKRSNSNFSYPHKIASQNANAGYLAVLGLNYHTSPLMIREKFIIPQSCITHALAALAQMPHIKEAALLSTCNRTEVFAVISEIDAGLKELESFFLSTQKIKDHENLKPNFRLLHDDVALHMFRIASGLDSLVVGEGQIMSQVKSAHKQALVAGTAGPILDQLFQLALNCGKRVRSETALSKKAVSVSSASLELAREFLGDLSKKNVLIIGAGKMAQICTKYLLSEYSNSTDQIGDASGTIVMMNRTAERLKHFVDSRLPNKNRLKTRFSLDEKYQLAAASDLIIVSTSAPNYLLKAAEFKQSFDNKPLIIIDISVPRNVDPEIGSLKGVELFYCDDLVKIVNRNRNERETLIEEAERIIFEVLDNFYIWERSFFVAPTINELRQKIEAIRAEHLEKNVEKGTASVTGYSKATGTFDHSDRSSNITNTSDYRLEFEELSRTLINQILHHPLVELKSASDYQSLRQQTETLRKLFRLDIFKQVETSSSSSKMNRQDKNASAV